MKRFKDNADKGKDAKKDSGVSLIPVMEKEENRLREELEHAKREAEARIHRAQEHAERKIDISQQGLPELMGQKRKQGLEKE